MDSQSVITERPRASDMSNESRIDEVARNGDTNGVNEVSRPLSAVDTMEQNAALDKVMHSDVSQDRSYFY